MAKIKYSIDIIKFMSMFETLTRSKLKDCFIIEEVIYFVVQPAQIGIAIGKKGANIQRLKSLLKNKEFKIVEFNPNLIQFVKNLCYPVKINKIEQEEDVIKITAPDLKSRGLLIGRAAKNLRNNEDIVNRYFKIKEIKVV